MHHETVNGPARLTFWAHVREFAVPPSMIESATARRSVGDWAGACAAARFDVDLDLRAAGRSHGQDRAAEIRADLRRLAPDLLRWHFPRIGPNGLLRPGLTVPLARYRDGRYLVARTPPAWAGAGQRISLALWDPARPRADTGDHPHPRPDRRFRLDLHRHLWDAGRSGELAERAGPGSAVERWPAEAALLLRTERSAGPVAVHVGTRRWLILDSAWTIASTPAGRPILPDAATRTPPDLELLRTGLIDADQLHPLVAAALVSGHRPTARNPDESGQPRLVECRGARHRIGVVDGVLRALDHQAEEIRREELLAALGGPPMPCLRAIDEAHRSPECLVDVRARLDHGDAEGALAIVEALIGPEALLRAGALHEELATAAQRRITHGLYRAGLSGRGPVQSTRDTRRRRDCRSHPRHALAR